MTLTFIFDSFLTFGKLGLLGVNQDWIFAASSDSLFRKQGAFDFTSSSALFVF